jgi:hypothetical protein
VRRRGSGAGRHRAVRDPGHAAALAAIGLHAFQLAASAPTRMGWAAARCSWRWPGCWSISCSRRRRVLSLMLMVGLETSRSAAASSRRGGACRSWRRDAHAVVHLLTSAWR